MSRSVTPAQKVDIPQMFPKSARNMGIFMFHLHALMRRICIVYSCFETAFYSPKKEEENIEEYLQMWKKMFSSYEKLA